MDIATPVNRASPATKLGNCSRSTFDMPSTVFSTWPMSRLLIRRKIAWLLHCKQAFENTPSYHFANNDLVIGRDARVKSDSFLLGAGLTRHNTSAQLNGEGANLVINSLVLPVGL